MISRQKNSAKSAKKNSAKKSGGDYDCLGEYDLIRPVHEKDIDVKELVELADTQRVIQNS
jgi:hypothetical protein